MMATMRTIVQKGDPILRETAQIIPIDEIRSTKIQSLIADMKALLSKEEYGVAIAAPQVGESLRLFVVAGKALIEKKRKAHKPEGEPDDTDFSGLSPEDAVYINPELVKMSRGKTGKHEGCLSVRGKWGIVPRAEKASVRAYNEKGERFTRGASGFLAHIFQHELDHLEGVLYIDKATELYDEEKDVNGAPA
ncbi:MAG: peptide deformylase [Parcubacteria group bacterium Gr01-1014_8]|nr:MAG: peptide deformylase [Parcubacteria group bacterium Gr01-1014_8]